MKKLNLAVIFGGKSAEHEVSLTSAHNIVKALNPERYNLFLIAIDKKGYWHQLDDASVLAKASAERKLPFDRSATSVTLVAAEGGTQLFDLNKKTIVGKIDIVFPVLHGPFGEDGSLQGFLKTLNVAFVGSSVLGSAVGMDKDVMKRLLKEANLPIGKFMVIRAHERNQHSFESVSRDLGAPFFVKSANLGSSVGVHKVRTASEWQAALDDAFLYDHKVVVEAFIQGREIECSVLGNESVRASVPGEVKPTHDFYSYEAKYLDDNGASLMIPAELDSAVTKTIQDLAIRTFQVLCCEGLSRVDFFVTANNEVYINEINTLPGFTQISMYPKMWEASGIGYSDLIDRIIELAISRFKKDSELKTSRS